MLCNTVALLLFSSCQIHFALLVFFTSASSLRTFDVPGFRLHLHCLLGRGGRRDSMLSNLCTGAIRCSKLWQQPDREYLALQKSFPNSCVGFRIASFLVQAVTVECPICFCTLWNCSCDICWLLSVFSWTTGIHLFVSESNLRHLDSFVPSPLDCGICLCVVTRSSTSLLMSFGWRNSAVFCVVYACSCGASFITATVSFKIDSGASTSTIWSSIHSGVSFVCVQPSLLV